MMKDVIGSIGSAAKKLFTNWGAMLIALMLYGALIAVLYLFVTTREASLLQIVSSLILLPIAAVILFFTLQAMGVSYVRIGVGPSYLLKRSVRDCWRLLMISLPVFLLASLIVYLIKDPDPKLMNSVLGANAALSRIATVLWYSTLYILLPLATIHLWIAAAREGIKRAFRGFFRNFVRAFSPRSLLIYMPVVATFGAIAYLLFFTRAQIGSGWGELYFFGARLALALVAIFFGWMLTLGSMAEMTARRALGEFES